MNKIFVFFLIIIFLNNCSFNSKSKFWTNEKNIKQEIKKNNIKELFTLEEALQKELNPDLEIKLIKLKLTNDKTNQNNNGSNFVARITALSFPIIIKVSVFSILFGIALEVVAELAELSLEFREWFRVVFAVLIEALFFWRINVHLSYINT